ncbi:hypothetical protein [Stratiformator vulcanicus]|uniref:Uncharacterized protein n=1 Tax=Stratiformator vulcanicus TaxID=2527980 RepID=A0A517QZP2_9PLAN|nr:hypothetical protein [Stratiformator vulcanicus]QDT37117.1 hypothetical protein Pan189_14850 [Stratiformator vulcanicus]
MKVPRENLARLCSPPPEQIGAAVDSNVRLTREQRFQIDGRSSEELRTQLLSMLPEMSAEYDRQLLSPDQNTQTKAAFDRPLIVGGHQPELFHPGVWAKNFALRAFAKQVGGAALHIVIDNDVPLKRSVEVPVGNREHPRTIGVPFDRSVGQQPWECLPVTDRSIFDRFAQSVEQQMSPWKVSSLIEQHWHAAVRVAERSGTLADAFTAVRRHIERGWGLDNLEVRLSDLCETEVFRHFVVDVFRRLNEFRQSHNKALAEHRTAMGIGDETRPVPDLSIEGEWVETPFWVWHEDRPQRQRLFARRDRGQLELSDSNRPIAKFAEADWSTDHFSILGARGYKIRSRALTTTLFLRMFLADLFVHGIGGAIYDEVTDRLIRSFYRVDPPQFATVSATLWLPIAKPFEVTPEDARRLERHHRRLHYSPEDFLGESKSREVEQLLARKRSLLGDQRKAEKRTGLSRSERRALRPENAKRYRRLHEVNNDLSARLSVEKQEAVRHLRGVQLELEANAVLKRREFSFALFPEAELRSFLTGLFSADPLIAST